MYKFATYNGGTVEVTREGVSAVLRCRAANGDTVFTALMSEGDAEELANDLDNAGFAAGLYDAAYDEGYNAGYADGFDSAHDEL